MRDFSKVKKLVGFLKGIGEVRWKFRIPSEEEAVKIKVFVDGYWAGCKVTRKSTSGGLLALGSHSLRTWSTTQATIATSSGEAELIAMSEGVSRAIGLYSMLKELLTCNQVEKVV